MSIFIRTEVLSKMPTCPIWQILSFSFMLQSNLFEGKYLRYLTISRFKLESYFHIICIDIVCS